MCKNNTVVRFTKNYLPILWSIKPQMPIRYHSIFESSTYLKNEIMKKRFLFNSSKVGQPEAKSSPKVEPKRPVSLYIGYSNSMVLP